MNIEYFLTKRKSNLLEWLHDHRVYSLESFQQTLLQQQLDVSKETLDFVEALYSPEAIIVQVVEPINSIDLTIPPTNEPLPDNSTKKSRPKKSSPPKEE